MSNDDRLVELEGRIVANELFMRAVLTGLVANASDNPLATLAATRRDMMSTLQLLERPVNDHADAVWDAAVTAIELQFAQVENRIKDALR
ncbi:hypothetical protein [Sphingosinicella sp. LY1275]|uniref:hypothetical protein n=1 Tax=Sphingosinicella sp. LY1275 TaxID=3095379 RepID=UPI002ADEEF71|nr:hypothetical protein [Sphingosinicella sp. LY1275]MEA1015588.1 hypothetical protein [Sphingosinicella sp. LY1275]